MPMLLTIFINTDSIFLCTFEAVIAEKISGGKQQINNRRVNYGFKINELE